MAKLVQALLSTIDGEYMEKEIWKNDKVDIYIFYNSSK